jgi:hypothetical protein
MVNEILETIKKRVTNEHPKFGELKIIFTFHSDKLVKYIFEKSDITLVNEENKNK